MRKNTLLEGSSVLCDMYIVYTCIGCAGQRKDDPFAGMHSWVKDDG